MDIYPQIYYVYFYLRSDFTPYYVGKGKNRRAWKKSKREIPLPKDRTKIILVEQNLTDIQAFMLERYYIRWFGRKDNGTGILRNLTDGGEGVSPDKAKEISLKKVKDGTHPFLRKNVQENNSITQKRLLKEGNHNSQKQIKNGTHVFFKNCGGNSIGKQNNIKRVGDGTHNFLGPDTNRKRIEEGTHNWVTNKGTVPCYGKNGNYHRIYKEVYDSQNGPMETWDWVFIKSKEGMRRKVLKDIIP